MEFRELYDANIRMQYISNGIIRGVHRQNYDTALRKLRQLTAELAKYMDFCGELKDTAGIDMEACGIEDFLMNIMEAQKASDYILIADLIEMQMLPFLLSIQESMRNSRDMMFCQEIWDENIGKLRLRDADLAELLEAEQRKWLENAAPRFWIEPTNSGLFTMASQDDRGTYYFHSNSNPQLEASEFAEYYYDRECDSYLILGLGLGYHCAALAGLEEGLRISIYENNPAVILQAMMANVMNWLWDNDRITLVCDPSLRRLSADLSVSEQKRQDVRFVIHSPSLRHVENAGVRKKLEEIFIRDSGIRNVRGLMERNFRENIRNYGDVIDCLRERFAGKRAVIAAAGPSLDKNIRLLLDKPEDVIVIATGTVLKKLLALGIAADYVIVTDANRRVIRQIEGCVDCGVPMLALSTAYQGFLRQYQGDKYIIFQQDFLSSVEEAGRLGCDTYGTGGSVSTTALDICIRLGCRSIAFIGLDLAYTDSLAHAEGTSRRAANDIDDMPAVSGYRLSRAQEQAAEFVIEKCQVKSSRLFDMYRHWMEKRIMQPDVTMPVYDASEGGSVIEGMRIVPLECFLKE